MLTRIRAAQTCPFGPVGVVDQLTGGLRIYRSRRDGVFSTAT